MSEYEDAINRENFMRSNMYMPGNEGHPMNTDQMYGLTPLTEELWNKLDLPTPTDPNLLFTGRMRRKASWKSITDILAILASFAYPHGEFKGKVAIAGGALFSILFGTKVNDIDLFIYGVSEDEAKKITAQLVGDNHITRTANAITYKCVRFLRKEREQISIKIVSPGERGFKYSLDLSIKFDVQIVLRLFRTFSQIPHGFDVDSCCFVSDGTTIWMTDRALHFLHKGYNTVNFDRLSPSYEWRLGAKYGAKRGVPIFVPGFIREQVKTDVLDKYLSDYFELVKNFAQSKQRYREIKNAHGAPQGLDRLLFLEKMTSQKNRHFTVIDRLAEESSDYSPTPYTRYNGMEQGSTLGGIFIHMNRSRKEYPEAAQNYGQLLDQLTDEEDPDIEEIITNSLGAMSFNFIKGTSKVCLEIPENVYECLECVHPWKIPRCFQFKVTNPGEQMTGTFHRTILADPSLWYHERFY
jgi:hypothetical protein